MAALKLVAYSAGQRSPVYASFAFMFLHVVITANSIYPNVWNYFSSPIRCRRRSSNCWSRVRPVAVDVGAEVEVGVAAVAVVVDVDDDVFVFGVIVG